ncbi:hypothetical protein EJB05_42222, partial [Eragrostis curvula]
MDPDRRWRRRRSSPPPPPRPPPPPPSRCLGVYDITVDEGGVFHPRPNCGGGPFRSLVETTAAIRRRHFPGSSGVVRVRTYGETVYFDGLSFPQRPVPYSFAIENGMFNVHPLGVGGPFESLSDAMAAIELHRTPPARIPPLPKEYYFTMKDGLFHLHPDGLGGPFSSLSDVTAAVQRHKESLKPPPFDLEKEGREQMPRMKKFLSELDPAEYIPVMAPPQTELRKYPTEATGSSVDHLEQNTCDPVLMEAIELFERLDEEEETRRSGMQWMQKEVTEAFESYLPSIGEKDIKYEFQKLDYQCLICDSFPKMYHHYNFTMKIKLPSERHWKEKTYFAEVKHKENEKQYFCCPLQRTDEGTWGHCFGCANVGINLKHPAQGGYEEGNEQSGFPFDTSE